MMIDEFLRFLITTGLISNTFVERDVYVCFNNAMMTQVDEVTKDKHIKANFIEFLEAFARACEKLSIGPRDEDEDAREMTEQERIN